MDSDVIEAIRALIELGKDHHCEEYAEIAEHYLDCYSRDEGDGPCPHNINN